MSQLDIFSGRDRPTLPSEERFFEMLDIEKPAEWAQRGGIAVHRNFEVTGMVIGGIKREGEDYEGQPAYHVLATDRDALVAWGRRYGQRESWLQRPKDRQGIFAGVWHFDVFGKPARRLERHLRIPPWN